MLDYEVFVAEYEKTHRVLGGRLDAETLDAYYESICLRFDDQDAVESFGMARRELEKFPVPVKLRELRDAARKARPQPVLPECPIIPVPITPRAKEILEEVFAGVRASAKRSEEFKSKVAF